MSPLDPRIEARHVGDRELDQIVRELVGPTHDTVLSWEIQSAIRDELALGVVDQRGIRTPLVG
ncbi:MAG TPA: hypothetical protein PKA33_15955 [Amaricoccus sp.]|nr:hypothetical protein [Amaricoccus sp.]HMR53849.1 hypothetical protein [Amaricoccus sp.]HMU00844.1 hypothetical protein [Amaricoccus sp.]